MSAAVPSVVVHNSSDVKRLAQVDHPPVIVWVLAMKDGRIRANVGVAINSSSWIRSAPETGCGGSLAESDVGAAFVKYLKCGAVQYNVAPPPDKNKCERTVTLHRFFAPEAARFANMRRLAKPLSL